MARKLSKTQERIVGLMCHGWEIGVSHGIYPRAWIQDGGVAKGGETETISMATFLRLRDLGVIWMPSGQTFPTDRYSLVSGGPL